MAGRRCGPCKGTGRVITRDGRHSADCLHCGGTGLKRVAREDQVSEGPVSEMTAGEHMAQAARLMARASRHGSMRRRSLDLQAAQVHASLASAITSAQVQALAAGLAARLRVRGPAG